MLTGVYHTISYKKLVFQLKFPPFPSAAEITYPYTANEDPFPYFYYLFAYVFSLAAHFRWTNDKYFLLNSLPLL